MMDRAQWQQENTRYLSLAIAWLRLRLQCMMPDATVTAGEVAEAEAAMLEAEEMAPPPALVELSSILGLTRFEQSMLLLCAAIELDMEIASFCGKIQGESQRYPTYALVLGLFDDPVWDIVSPERPLRSWRLIEIHQSGVQPLTVSPIKADERIVNYLKGLNYLDDRLQSFLAPLTLPAVEADLDACLAPSQQQVAAAIAQQLQAATHWQSLPLIGERSLEQAVVGGSGGGFVRFAVVSDAGGIVADPCFRSGNADSVVAARNTVVSGGVVFGWNGDRGGQSRKSFSGGVAVFFGRHPRVVFFGCAGAKRAVGAADALF
jgi:hypothetical protein